MIDPACAFLLRRAVILHGNFQTGTSTLKDGIRGLEIVLGIRIVSVLFHICSMFAAAST